MANDRNRNRFVDHALFLLAAKAFQDTGLDSPELIPVRDRLIKIIFSDFYAELDEAIYSLADKGIRVMKNRLERQAAKPKNIQNLWEHIEVLEDTMIQLRQQQDLFGETFPGKASMNAMRVARAAAEDDPTAKLAQYASIPMLTGQLKLKNWISDVAQLAGAPISESELEINEASTASNLGSDLRDAEKDLLLAPPNSLESAEAQDRKAQILQEIDETQKNARSNNNILGLVSAAATPQEVYTQKTKTGRELGMGSGMERAMLAQGKVMIAAGAGAGKTRLLAGKVTYLIKEQGISPDQIIAVSFTKKSAVELARRIEEYGVPGASKMRSFATINSLGVTICNKYGLARGKDLIKPWDEQKLIRMAMQQVGMRSDAPKPPNTQIGLLGEEPEFWGKTTPATPAPVTPSAPSAPSQAPAAAPTGNQFRQIIDDLRRLNDSNPSREWKAKTEGFLSGLYRYNSVDQLSGPQLKWFRNLMDRGGIRVKGINASLTESVEVDEGFWSRLGSEISNRIAAIEQQADVDRKFEASKDLEGAAPSNLPQAAKANMWFNKGWEGDSVLTGSSRGTIKPGDVVRYISKKSGSLISPDKAFTELGSNLGEFVWNEKLEKNEFVPYKDAFLACAYGAFLWLKGNHENFKHTFTFDDQILLAANALRNRPDIRADMQKNIKHLIVDECQDANKAQQVLFGLIAGTVDPATMEDYGDNRIAINTFMQIGDDKQSIYGFRGATPNEFIKRSDLKGGGFKTHLLDTNYRSGGMIVGAANALMEHQKLDGKNVQVPMVCNVKASSEGQGTVTNVRPLTPASAVEYVADHIKELLDSGTETLGDAAETTFGIVTRTNGEATDYAMALIKRGIVFRMKKRYHPLLQSTIRNGASLMRLAAKNTSAKDLDDALLYIIQNFVAGLGKTFIEKAQRAAKGTLVDFFLSGDWRKVAGNSTYWKGACESMIPFITSLRQMAEQDLTPALLLDSIMNLPMPGDIRNNETGVEEERLPIKAHLVKKLKEDVKATEDLLDEHMDANGNVPESAYEDAALAPVSRLFDMASDFASTEQFLSYYDELVKISEKTFVEARDDKEDDVKGAVILDTVHQWKGLEAKHVFIPATQGVFPPNEGVPGEETRGRVISPGELLEERRLFYVALTRGKESVTTLSPQYRDLDGEKPIPMAPSRFISEACIPGSTSAGLPPVPEDDDSVMFDDQYKAYMEG